MPKIDYSAAGMMGDKEIIKVTEQGIFGNNSAFDLARLFTAPSTREDLGGLVQAINPFWIIEQIRLQKCFKVRAKNFIF